jgi:hypothetical protein
MTSQFKSPLASFRQERFAQELAIGTIARRLLCEKSYTRA